MKTSQERATQIIILIGAISLLLAILFFLFLPALAHAQLVEGRRPFETRSYPGLSPSPRIDPPVLVLLPQPVYVTPYFPAYAPIDRNAVIMHWLLNSGPKREREKVWDYR